MQEQIPASLSLFLGEEVGFWCYAPVPYWHEPWHRQADAPLLYASILVSLLRSQVRYKSLKGGLYKMCGFEQERKKMVDAHHF